MFWRLYFFAFALFFFLFHTAWPFENQCRPGCHAQIVRFFFLPKKSRNLGWAARFKFNIGIETD
jgi:hypothetical protein